MPRLVVPLAMVWVGWNWVRGGVRKEQSYSSEIIVTLKLSSPDLGTRPERESILALKHRLENELDGKHLGEVEGEEFGDGECSIFVQTNVPAEAERLIREFLASEAPPLSYAVNTSEG